MRSIIALTILAITVCLLLGSPALPQDSGKELTDPSSATFITAPRPILTVHPQFLKGRKKKKEGIVTLKGTITAQGGVRDLRIESGDHDLARSAQAAIEQWQYSPALKHGSPVDVPHVFEIIFSRHDQTVHLGPDEISGDLPLGPTKEIEAEIGKGIVTVVGKDVTPPHADYAPDPEYAELARKLKYSGNCTIGAVVDREGHIAGEWVATPLGEGLDEKALDVIQKWKFQPAMRDGEPVAVLIQIEVTFRIY